MIDSRWTQVGGGPGASGEPGRLERPDELAERLLDLLREAFGRPALAYADRLQRVDAGGEAVIYGFRLAGVDGEQAEPLILRLLRPSIDPDQVRFEQAVHDSLGALGFPVPKVFLARADPEPLGGAFVVLERLRGHMLLEEVRRPAELLRRPLRFPLLVHDALRRVPDLLAGLQARLHALDPEPLRRALLEAGFAETDLTPEGRLDELEGRARKAGLPGLDRGFQWLRAHAPSPHRRVICHGDFVFTNVCVEGRRATGVLDWSTARVADASYDVAGTVARLGSPVVGVPTLVRRLFERTQQRMVRRYLHAYRRRAPLDGEALHYHEAYFLLAELVWSGERVVEGCRYDGAIEDRWLHPEVIALGAERFHATTGADLQPILPDDDDADPRVRAPERSGSTSASAPGSTEKTGGDVD